MAKYDDLLKKLNDAKTTGDKLQKLSDLFVATCVVAKNGGIADSFITMLTTAESVDLGTFAAVATIVDGAERKARNIVGAHKASAKMVKDVNTVTL